MKTLYLFNTKVINRLLAFFMILPPVFSWFLVYAIKGTAGIVGWWTLMIFGLVSMFVTVLLLGS